jgi:branched-chain amino acid transport system ATP-binding protein
MSQPLLKTMGLSLSFGGVIAAEAIDFELTEGERLAIVGQNGAGKTTFVNICTGYLKPSSGKVLLDGEDITGMCPRMITRKGVAFVPNSTDLH